MMKKNDEVVVQVAAEVLVLECCPSLTCSLVLKGSDWSHQSHR